jgi:hypothetical protein
VPCACCDGSVAKITAQQAQAVAQALELDLDELDICLACLSFVSFPLDAGDDREVRRALAYITPHIWEEGLALPAVAALERARRTGLPHAEAALADIDALGSRSRVVREIVLRLAADLGRVLTSLQRTDVT